jgi:hypothetical protein
MIVSIRQSRGVVKMSVTSSEVVDVAAGGGARVAPAGGAAAVAGPNLAQQQSRAAIAEWLRNQVNDALSLRQEALQQEAIEVFGGDADMLLIGPFQFFGLPGSPPYPPSDVVRVGESAFVAVVQVYAPLPNLAGTPPAFALPYEIRLRTGSLDKWSLAEPSLQATITGNLDPMSNVQIDFFDFTPTQEDLCEMNAWIAVLDAQNNPSGVGGFARSVIPADPGGIFPVDPPPSDTGLRFANVRP